MWARYCASISARAVFIQEPSDALFHILFGASDGRAPSRLLGRFLRALDLGSALVQPIRCLDFLRRSPRRPADCLSAAKDATNGCAFPPESMHSRMKMSSLHTARDRKSTRLN